MPLTVVQAAATVYVAGASASVTLPQATGAGNTLVACVTGDNTTTNPSVTGITVGGAADNWQAVVTDPGTGVPVSGAIWYDPGCAAGQTAVVVSATSSGLGQELWVAVYEVSGVLSFDKGSSGDANSGATTWSSGATATTTQANEIFFGACTATSAIPTVTGAGTWTTQSNASGSYDQRSGYQAVSATQAAAFSGTIPSGGYVAVVATFSGPATPLGPGAGASLIHPGRGPAARFRQSPRSTTTPPPPPYVPDTAQARRSITWHPGYGPGGLFAKAPGDTSITRVQAPPGSPYRSLGFYFLDSSGSGDPTGLVDGSVPPDKFAHIVVQQYVAGNTIGPGATTLAAIRAAHPSSKVLAYQNLGCMIAGPHSNGRPTTLVTQEDAAAHEAAFPADSWNCHKISDGTVVPNAGFPYVNMANLQRPSYQAAASQHFGSIAADGFDGIFLDDTNMYPGHGMNSAVPGPADPNACVEFLTDNAYRDATVATVAAIAPVARGLGLLVVPNVGMNPWTTDHYAGYTAMLQQKIIDGQNREFWANWGGAAGVFTDSQWPPTMQVLIDAGAAGVFSMLNSYLLAPQNDYLSITYSTASYYLFWNGTTADSCWYNYGEPLGAYHWYVNLGLPLEPAYQVNGGLGPGWMRHYSLGVALVNPSSTTPATFPLGGSYVDPTGLVVTSVTLAPATAQLLTTAATTRTDLGPARAPSVLHPGRGPSRARFADLPGSTALPPAPPVVWSLVQQSAAQANTSTNTLPGNSTAGNLLVAVTGCPSGASITAPAGWVQGPQVFNGAVNDTSLWYYPANPGGLSSFTFAGPGSIWVSVAEFTGPGVAAVAAPSDTGTNTGGAVTSITVATAGTAKTGDLVVAGFFEHLAATSAITWTDPAAFTGFAGLKVTSLVNHCYAAYYLAANASGVQSVTGTSSVTGNATNGWTGAVMTFTLPSGTVVPGAGAVAGAGSVTAAVTQAAAATAAGAGVVNASGVITGTANVAGAGAATAAATQIAPATATAAGVVTAAATQAATAAPAGAGAATAKATQDAGTTTAAAGAGAVTGVATQVAPATAAGAGAVNATASGGGSGVAAVAGAGSVTAVATQAALGTAAGAGAVTAAGTQAATGSAVGAGAATAAATQAATATAAGAGAVATAATQRATAAATGAGVATASGALVLSATIAGAGSATAKAAQGATATAAGAATLAALATQAAAASLAGAGAVNATGSALVAFTVGALTAADAPAGVLTAATASGGSSGGVLTATDTRTGGPGG